MPNKIDFVVGTDDFAERIADGLSQSYRKEVPFYPLSQDWYSDQSVNNKVRAIEQGELFEGDRLITGRASELIKERTTGKTGLLVLRDKQGRERYFEESYLWAIASTALSLLRADRFSAGNLRVFLPMLPDQKSDKNWPNETRPEVLARDVGKTTDYQTLPMLLAPHGVTEIVSIHPHPRHLRPGHPGSFEVFEYGNKRLELRSLSLLDGYSQFVLSNLDQSRPLVVSPEKPGGAGVSLAVNFARSLSLPYEQVFKSVDATGKAKCQPFDANGQDLLILDDFTKSLTSVLELLSNAHNHGKIFVSFYHLDLTTSGMEKFYAMMRGERIEEYGSLPRPARIFTTNSLYGEAFDHEAIKVYDIVPRMVRYYSE